MTIQALLQPILSRLPTASLGRVPMYRVVSVALAALFLAAVALSAAERTLFTPGALLLTGAVAVGVTAIVSAVIAAALRTRAHYESSVITGLLIVFLGFPGSTAEDLRWVALTAAIAGASKFLLAFRGRHLANPAAVGAVIAGWAGAPSELWWVASQDLLPLVVIGAIVIALRTGTAAVIGVFLLACVPLTWAAYLDAGMVTTEALRTVLISTPVIFLAGFMLTEPLTLPPLRLQRLGIAALVGLLVAAPTVMSVFADVTVGTGNVFLTPAAALVIGNLVAFWGGQRRGVALTFAGSSRLAGDTWEFEFTPAAPVRHNAGQFLEITVPHSGEDFRGSRRVFSLTSAPGAATVKIATTIVSFRREQHDFESALH